MHKHFDFLAESNNLKVASNQENAESSASDGGLIHEAYDGKSQKPRSVSAAKNLLDGRDANQNPSTSKPLISDASTTGMGLAPYHALASQIPFAPATDKNPQTLADQPAGSTKTAGAKATETLTEGSVPKFEELFGKLDLDKNESLSHEEVKSRMHDPDLNKYEQGMAQMVEAHYKAIRPMDGAFSLRHQKLDREDMKCLDNLVETGNSSGLFMNYVRSIAGTDTAAGVGLGLFIARASYWSSDPKAAGFVVGTGVTLAAGSFAFGTIRGGINYYAAKSEHADMIKEFKEIGHRSEIPQAKSKSQN